ncbi:MAG: AIR synthase-related protein [Evtepia sp.]
MEALGGKSLGETLLAPTRIYVKSILALMEQVTIKSVSHITGGGFYENIPRSLPEGMTAKIKKSDVPVPPIFDLHPGEGQRAPRGRCSTPSTWASA